MVATRGTWLAAASALGAALAKPDGSCGYECTTDSDCSGCGAAGLCSCPDGANVSFYQESCSCASAPADPPAGESDIKDSVWPSKWTANVDAWCYGDFTHKAAEAHGKFYFDGVNSRTRADWAPYINGKSAKQVWLADLAKGTSKYYVKSGPVCLYFPISDPGASNGALVGVEYPDWMKRCHDAGYARFVAREQVNVDGRDEWADHWSCRLDYAAANQSITFQNWHSIGRGGVPKGLPMRVTGGNSAPNPTQGSPRMNSVWYNNFVTGDDASVDADFRAPNFGIFCIPVGGHKAKEFFGREVTTADVFSPTFHRRAHYLPHAEPSSADLRRAQQPKPGAVFAGSSFGESMRVLNAALRRSAAKTRNCSAFSLAQLHEARTLLFEARTPQLDAVYRAAADTRSMAHVDEKALEEHHKMELALSAARPDLTAKLRDGACHEAILWFIHHLTESARREIGGAITLPLLPEAQHHAPERNDTEAIDAHERYNAQISCAICHVSVPGTISV